MTKWIVSAALTLAACTGCAGSRVEALYGGPDGMAAIETPEKVTAYRVIRPGILKYVRAPDMLAGYEILSGPVDVDAASAAELGAIFADDSIYDWERAKACEFEPGVALRFARAGSNLDVLLCFSCDELAAFREDKRLGSEDFDVARPRLLAVVKRLFPGDEKIQSLTDRRTGG
jgi:hypothetical protein